MIKVKKDTTIYVACPARAATGGPELLHQLVFKMNQLGYNAEMFYYPNNEQDPVHPFYKKYGNHFVREIEDKENNILIVPEVKTSLIYEFKRIRKVIWWLSANNFQRHPRNITRIEDILRHVIDINCVYNFEKIDGLYHLVQSIYAQNYLITKGINREEIYYLSDYINPIFISKQIENKNLVQKEDIVVYNPKKGYEFTKKIIDASPDISFMPIINLTPEQVSELLLKAKVYIDFGNHPGKDRIPREAAISKCCVIVGKKGSAAFREDVPIDDQYKFEVKEKNIPHIIEKIKYLLANYSTAVNDFETYRRIILNEEKKFEEDIKKIFVIS